MAVLEPTAANELSPAKRPTTTISAALNLYCFILSNSTFLFNFIFILFLLTSGPL